MTCAYRAHVLRSAAVVAGRAAHSNILGLLDWEVWVETNVLHEALLVTICGMTSVFLFLLVLVLVMLVLTRLAPAGMAPSASRGQAAPNDDQALIAVLHAAVEAYERDRHPGGGTA